MQTLATDAAIESVAQAIFKEPVAAVVEAYSAFGCELLELHGVADLCAYAQSRRDAGRDLHIAVLYPDMAGKLTKIRMELDPAACEGHAFRYKAEGWGLIWVRLTLSPKSRLDSFISANSEKRAVEWASTYPEMEDPSTWHWPAVARHLRRLRRALKLTS